MKQIDQSQKILILIAVLFITPITGAGIDIYTPVMPIVAKYFDVSRNFIQLSITAYVIGYGVSQVFTGIFADALGRKPVILINLFMYVLCSILCALTHQIYIFLLLRFLQGIFVSGPGVLNKAYILDTTASHKIQGSLNYITISWALGLILAPMLGGALFHIFHTWKAIFYFLSMYGFVAFLIFTILPETLAVKKVLSFKNAFIDILMLIKNNRYTASVLSVGCIYSLLISFSLFAPFIIIGTMKYSPIFYGKIAVLIGVSWFLGNMVARFISGTGSTKHAVVFCFSFALLVALSALYFHHQNLLSIVLPSFIIIALMSYGFPKFYGLSVRMFPNIAGLCGAVMGSLFLITTGIVSIVVSALPINIATLLLTYAVLCFLGLVLYTFVIKDLNP